MQRASRLLVGVRASRLLVGVRAAASFSTGGSGGGAPSAARSASESVHGKIDLETVSSAAMRRRLRASSADSPPRALVEVPRADALVDAPPPSAPAPAPGMAATLGANVLFGFAMTVAFTGVIGLVRAIGF
jgi:hypothetical protein